MLQALIILFSIYTAIKVYVSVMQMGYIIDEKRKDAVLMTKAKYQEAAKYAVAKEKLDLTAHLVEYLLFIWWALIGFEMMYSFLSQYISQSPFLASIIFLIGYFTIDYIVSLPLSIYQTFVIDKHFGFTKTTPKLFIIDQIKSIMLFLTIGIGVMALLVWIIESFEMWWLYGFVFIMAILLIINFAYPTIIAPMFNNFTPLDDEELKKKIEVLMENAGMKADGVFVMDASKRDNRLNAYFGGFGKSKRVVLFDTLLAKLSHDELIAVLGHELGHYKHGDIWKNIALMTILFFGVFYLLGHLPESIFAELRTAPIAGAKIAFIMLVFPLVTFIWMPIMSLFSRHNEYQADEYGSSVGGKEHLVSALIKLVGENKAFPKSHPLYIFFYYSHPPILERLKSLGFDESAAKGESALPENGIFSFIKK
ncbi:MAG: M48 family metallopeptidase [Campylobacterales bacterium]|nr:M48 family metallopeptidase [Campylobacterales bacterium]